MAEYWKSTPKYWCKFCKIFVRDTALEKKQHEATGKHQNSIQKSLRDLHKNQGREDREKQRAQAEVARLNGVVSGKVAPSSAGPSQPTVAKAKPHFTASRAQQATADDRRRQAEQLAAMGIAVPDEFRSDMALAGGWSTVSATPVFTKPVIKEDEDEAEDKKDLFAAHGERKRKLDDEDEDADAGSSKKKSWGTTLKAYPGDGGGQAQDFDALLSSTSAKQEVKAEPEVLEDGVKLKKEESSGDVETAGISTATEDAPGDTPVVFKKRKGKR